MFVTILGWLLCGLSVVVFAFDLVFLYIDAKTTYGGNPNLDKAIVPPVFLAVGLGMLGRRYPDFALPVWAYVAIWLGSTVLLYLLHEFVSRAAKSKARREPSEDDDKT